MNIFKVHIDREVTTYDRFTRFIQAETAEEAQAIGDKLASDANTSCPDDAGPGEFDTELGDWSVNEVTLADDEDQYSPDFEICNAEEEEDEDG